MQRGGGGGRKEGRQTGREKKREDRGTISLASFKYMGVCDEQIHTRDVNECAGTKMVPL